MQNKPDKSGPSTELGQPATNKGIALPNLVAAVPAWPSPLTYSVGQTAVIIGCTDATVYRLIKRRILTAVPGLRHKLISRRQVHKFVDSGSNE